MDGRAVYARFVKDEYEMVRNIRKSIDDDIALYMSDTFFSLDPKCFSNSLYLYNKIFEKYCADKTSLILNRLDDTSIALLTKVFFVYFEESLSANVEVFCKLMKDLLGNASDPNTVPVKLLSAILYSDAVKARGVVQIEEVICLLVEKSNQENRNKMFFELFAVAVNLNCAKLAITLWDLCDLADRAKVLQHETVDCRQIILAAILKNYAKFKDLVDRCVKYVYFTDAGEDKVALWDKLTFIGPDVQKQVYYHLSDLEKQKVSEYNTKKCIENLMFINKEDLFVLKTVVIETALSVTGVVGILDDLSPKKEKAGADVSVDVSRDLMGSFNSVSDERYTAQSGGGSGGGSGGAGSAVPRSVVFSDSGIALSSIGREYDGLAVATPDLSRFGFTVHNNMK